jgi:hypothetical protein
MSRALEKGKISLLESLIIVSRVDPVIATSEACHDGVLEVVCLVRL